jgi:hypothetical protein
MNALEFEKAKDIVDTPKAAAVYGFDAPKLEVTFKHSDKPDLRVSLGANSTVPEGIYLKTSTAPAVMVVSKELYDKLNVKADDLVEAKPAATDAK